MYMIETDRDKLINAISSYGADAHTALAEMCSDEASHPPTYMAGYLQGYVHAIDAACSIISHPEEIKTR